MASITKKPNGTYLVRISAGKNDFGKPVTVSKTFTPSKQTLSYHHNFPPQNKTYNYIIPLLGCKLNMISRK